MKNFDEEPDPQEVFLSGEEAEAFCGAKWRKPADAELEELALLIAEDYVRGSAKLFEEFEDEAEMLIRIQQEKEDTLKSLKNLTMALDFQGLNMCVFYTFDLMFSKGQKTGTLTFEDGLVRFLKRDGELRVLDSRDDYLFEM